MKRFYVVLFGVALCGALGCNPAKEDKEEEAKAPGASAATEGEGEGSECEQYADKLCEKVGEKSANCRAAKQTTKLMPPAACTAGLGDLAYTETQVAGLRKTCSDLVDKLCKDLGEDTETCAMVQEKTPQFPPRRCQDMMKRYDKVLADLKKMEDANKPLPPEKQEALVEDAMATFGSEDAEVTVVEFSDFQCPYCSRAAKTVNEIKEKYGSDVYFVFRHFPLSFHKDAKLAAEAAMAAAAQGKFWEFHDILFENQKALKREDLEKHAKKIGMDMAKFKEALDEHTYRDEVEADLELGKEVSVRGTPTLFVNGKRVSDPTKTAVVSAAIDKALGKGEGEAEAAQVN